MATEKYRAEFDGLVDQHLRQLIDKAAFISAWKRVAANHRISDEQSTQILRDCLAASQNNHSFPGTSTFAPPKLIVDLGENQPRAGDHLALRFVLVGDASMGNPEIAIVINDALADTQDSRPENLRSSKPGHCTFEKSFSIRETSKGSHSIAIYVSHGIPNTQQHICFLAVVRMTVLPNGAKRSISINTGRNAIFAHKSVNTYDEVVVTSGDASIVEVEVDASAVGDGANFVFEERFHEIEMPENWPPSGLAPNLDSFLTRQKENLLELERALRGAESALRGAESKVLALGKNVRESLKSVRGREGTTSGTHCGQTEMKLKIRDVLGIVATDSRQVLGIAWKCPYDKQKFITSGVAASELHDLHYRRQKKLFLYWQGKDSRYAIIDVLWNHNSDDEPCAARIRVNLLSERMPSLKVVSPQRIVLDKPFWAVGSSLPMPELLEEHAQGALSLVPVTVREIAARITRNGTPPIEVDPAGRRLLDGAPLFDEQKRVVGIVCTSRDKKYYACPVLPSVSAGTY